MNSPRRFPAKNRTIVLLGIKLFLAGSIILLLIRRIRIEKLIDALTTADQFFLLLAALLLLLNLFFQFIKWRLVVLRINSSVDDLTILFSLLVGLALGFVTPGRVGEIARAAFIPHTDWAKLTGLLLIDKVIALVVLYFFGMIGLAYVLSFSLQPMVWLPILFSALLLSLVVLTILYRPKTLKTLIAGGRFRLLKRLSAGAAAASPALVVKLFLYSILFLLTYCTQFVLFYRAFESRPLLSAYSAATAVMFVKALLPISLGDLGVRESASVYLFGQVGGSPAAAFDASLLLFVVNVLVPAVIGLILFFGKRFNEKVDRGS